jgi:hypothetical protein
MNDLMNDEPLLSPSPARPTFSRRALIVYLLLVIAVFALVSAASVLARQQGMAARTTLGGAMLAYVLNALIFGGAAYLIAIRPRKITWAELGIAPPRWRWEWLLIAAGVVIILLPVRMVVGAITQWLFGGFEALQARAELLGGELSWARFFVTLIGAGLLVPIAEELFFRGFLYTALRQHTTVWPAVAISSLIFAAGHYDAAGVIAAGLIMGIALALIYEYTHSLWASIAMHAINNTAAVVLTYGLMLLQEWLKSSGVAGS